MSFLRKLRASHLETNKFRPEQGDKGQRNLGWMSLGKQWTGYMQTYGKPENLTKRHHMELLECRGSLGQRVRENVTNEKEGGRGCLAGSVIGEEERETLDLWIVNLSPTLGIEVI